MKLLKRRFLAPLQIEKSEPFRQKERNMYYFFIFELISKEKASLILKSLINSVLVSLLLEVLN